MPHDSPPPPSSGRRPYTPPTVRLLGTIAELTRGAAGSASDGIGQAQPGATTPSRHKRGS